MQQRLGGRGGSCSEFKVGGQVTAAIGGDAKALVAAQCVADFAGAAQAQLVALTAGCKSVAGALGASSADQAAADATPVRRDKARVWCDLATKTLTTAKAAAGGSLTLQTQPSTCKLLVSKKLACQARCAGTATCDSAANPVRCTGGVLSGDFCTGGKLEGGCQVDAKCDADCDVSNVAAADCLVPAVTLTSVGAADPSKAATLKSSLEAALPSLFALKAHFAVESDYAAVVTGNADVIADIDVLCIQPILAAAVDSVSDVMAGVDASTNVLGSVQ